MNQFLVLDYELVFYISRYNHCINMEYGNLVLVIILEYFQEMDNGTMLIFLLDSDTI
jgi:hypothetical protein